MVTMKFEGMNDWLQTKDLYIVDRGVRDVIVFLEEWGLSVKMPVYLKKKFQTAYYRSRLSTKL